MLYKFRDYAVNPKGAYKVPVPSDFLFISRGKVLFLECKEFAGKRFEFRRVRDVQWEYGDKITDHGIEYLFLILHTETMQLFVVPYEALHEKLMNGAKSVPISWLQKYPHVEMKGKYSMQLYNILMTGKNFVQKD